MRCAWRNRRKFWYAQYEGEEYIYDGDYNTGEKTTRISEPIMFEANISPATGAAYVKMFGNSLQYDKVIITDDQDIPINENSVLFVDKFPERENPVPDYIVKRVARHLQFAVIAISRIEASQ